MILSEGDVMIYSSACDSKVGRWSASYIIQKTAGMELAFSLYRC